MSLRRRGGVRSLSDVGRWKVRGPQGMGGSCSFEGLVVLLGVDVVGLGWRMWRRR